jgi:all-trans-8'-apo-beta-carotenal 15,15'-oxygenase
MSARHKPISRGQLTVQTSQSPDRSEVLHILRRSFATVEEEHTDLTLHVRGEIPAGLKGVLYRNGPGRMERGGHDYGHLFDGDGHVCRFSFDGGRVGYTNRYVRTAFFDEEERAGRIIYRCLGTNRPGGMPANFLRLRFKNAANTHVIAHAGRLLALYEGGPPYELDPLSLETRGVWDLDGALKNPFDAFSRFMSPIMPFAAHPSRDPVTGELFGFGLLAGRPNRLMIYRIDAEGRCTERREFRLGRSSFVHDVLMTEHWLLFLLPQVDYGMGGVLLGYTSAAGSMSMHTERPMRLLLVPRGGGEAVSFETIPGFAFHFAGGAEHPDGTLHANLVHHSHFPSLDSVDDLIVPDEALGRLTRLEINPRTRETNACVLSAHAHEMPRLGSDPGRIFSCGVPAGRNMPFYSAILVSRLSTDGRSARTTVRDFYPDLPGEPVPIDVDGETLLMSLVYRAREHRSELLILHADDLSTLAEIALPHSLPPGFHGSWVDAG